MLSLNTKLFIQMPDCGSVSAGWICPLEALSLWARHAVRGRDLAMETPTPQHRLPIGAYTSLQTQTQPDRQSGYCHATDRRLTILEKTPWLSNDFDPITQFPERDNLDVTNDTFAMLYPHKSPTISIQFPNCFNNDGMKWHLVQDGLDGRLSTLGV